MKTKNGKIHFARSSNKSCPGTKTNVTAEPAAEMRIDERRSTSLRVCLRPLTVYTWRFQTGICATLSVLSAIVLAICANIIITIIQILRNTHWWRSVKRYRPYCDILARSDNGGGNSSGNLGKRHCFTIIHLWPPDHSTVCHQLVRVPPRFSLLRETDIRGTAEYGRTIRAR